MCVCVCVMAAYSVGRDVSDWNGVTSCMLLGYLLPRSSYRSRGGGPSGSASESDGKENKLIANIN